MGIDIYTKWKNQNKEEEKNQITGFSITSGNTGYLREAYHGGPYVTKYLVQEAFESGEAKIPAILLRERLPSACLMALYRENKIYGQGTKNPENIDNFADIHEKLKNVFAVEMKDLSHEEFVNTLSQKDLDYMSYLIEMKLLPPFVQTFVEFVQLCELKEKETGEPCEIIASY